VLGVLTVTLAIGVMLSVTAYRDAVDPEYTDRVQLLAPMVGEGRMRPPPPDATTVPPALTDEEDEALLRSLPGAAKVAAVAEQPVHVVGSREVLALRAYRGDTALAPRLDSGHWPTGPGEVAAPSRFLNQRGLEVGDTITLEHEGTRTQVRVVAVTVTNSAGELFADWSLLQRLAPEVRANTYLVQFSAGADQQAYVAAVRAAEPGLEAVSASSGGSSQAVVLISAATVLTVILGAVAALGVFNTVVLNARERRRDLGMLKSIGMTPRQVTVMMVTSMGALGVVGGLIGVPLGVAAHQVIAPAMMRAAQSTVFDFVLDVYRVPMLALLALAGIAIAVLGAVIPARSAARTPIATVLHNE
jgi:putative ABC transport system permease protein